MREINIKYNPYKVETEITVDGALPKNNSRLNVGEDRLQEWIEDLPEWLREEYNTKEFKITFRGTTLDYEDVVSVAEESKKSGMNIICNHIPAKEVKDKERLISDIFERIQNGPFEELKQKDIINAFKLARERVFPVNVVATMSAGKSTLINALLQRRLMPAKQEACTATITEIKDSDSTDFSAKVYDKSQILIETHPVLTLEIMRTVNDNNLVSVIKVEGNIPFINSDDVTLVLVDTPGPNNSRDEEHKKATYNMLDESSKTLVLYILNATQLEVNDDFNLISHVADSMRVKGKQSKDRFLFVVNKLDDFKKDEDSVDGALSKVKKYLEKHGIENPNVFPASALTALDIRTTFKDIDFANIDLDSMSPEGFEVYAKIRKINSNPDLHLEQKAPLTPSIRGEINMMLSRAKETKNMKAEALVHTGIIPIETAIKMYITKYAKTAKIKNIVDTFTKKLEDARSFEKTKQDIASKKEEQGEILRQIEGIREKLTNAEQGKSFKDEIDKISFDSDVLGIARDIVGNAQGRIKGKIDELRGKELEKQAVDSIVISFEQFSKQLEAEIQVKLEKAIFDKVSKSANECIEKYSERIKGLSDEISVGGITIKPFDFLSGEFNPKSSIDHIFESIGQTKKRGTGQTETVRNPERKGFWGFFKFWKPWNIEEEIFEDVKYIKGEDFATRYFADFQVHLMGHKEIAEKYAKEAAQGVKKEFKSNFEKLDNLILKKMNELENCASDNSKMEQIIAETQSRLDWLEKIQSDVQKILEI
jgi:hypothetical protein